VKLDPHLPPDRRTTAIGADDEPAADVMRDIVEIMRNRQRRTGGTTTPLRRAPRSRGFRAPPIDRLTL
jgi:hypothetical protein